MNSYMTNNHEKISNEYTDSVEAIYQGECYNEDFCC